jgi:phosphohistidine phosphatase
MTLTLILTRHAKSDWGRPAACRLRPAAERPGPPGPHCASGNGWPARIHVPGEVIVSGAPAHRRDVGGDRVRPSTRNRPCRVDRQRSTTRGPSTMLAVLRRHGTPVLLIGHNPGIGGVRNRLAITRPRIPGSRTTPPAPRPSSASREGTGPISAGAKARSWTSSTPRDLTRLVPEDLAQEQLRPVRLRVVEELLRARSVRRSGPGP